MDREQAVAQACVSIAGALVADYDVTDLHTTLTSVCADLLNVASAGLLLLDTHGRLRLAAASSEDTRELELFLLQCDQGPCLDCHRSGAPVSVADLGQEAARWPRFVPTALAAGFASVHALPMRLATIAAVSRSRRPTWPRPESGGPGSHRKRFARASVVALDARVVIEQAKGMLAELEDLSPPQALAALREHARQRNLRLTDLAHAVIDRDPLNPAITRATRGDR